MKPHAAHRRFDGLAASTVLLDIDRTPYSYARLEQERPDGQFWVVFEESGLGDPRYPDRRDTRESGGAQRAFARDFPPDRRKLSRHRGTGGISQLVATVANCAVAGFGSQCDVGSGTARPDLRAAHFGRPAAD